ncbi:MAG TPA: hypothetical protein VM029_11175, partial [Opitutaceae bacterium]|nr:hypothetical protein [Opitutaceae bacterium]
VLFADARASVMGSEGGATRRPVKSGVVPPHSNIGCADDYRVQPRSVWSAVTRHRFGRADASARLRVGLPVNWGSRAVARLQCVALTNRHAFLVARAHPLALRARNLHRYGRNAEQAHRFHVPERRDMLQGALFETTAEFGWQLDAWAVLSNHYHFVARSPGNAATLRRVVGKLHMQTAKQVNQLDRTPGKKVWFEYWDTHPTYERPYFARLNYVHNNPAKHGIVPNSLLYRWCSATWFAEHASPVFRGIINRFKTDGLNVPDDFQGGATCRPVESGVVPPHSKHRRSPMGRSSAAQCLECGDVSPLWTGRRVGPPPCHSTPRLSCTETGSDTPSASGRRAA